MMKTIFLNILVFSALFANAQKGKKLSPLKEKFVTIKMATLPIAEFPKNSISVSGITVIQKLADSIRLGYMQTETGLATLRFAKPLSTALQVQVNRMYKHEYKKNGLEILWVINDLRFGSNSAYEGNNLASYTRLNADAYNISGQGRLFKKICALDTVLVVLNMGGGYGNDLENALRVLLRKTLLAPGNITEETGDGITIEQIAGEATS